MKNKNSIYANIIFKYSKRYQNLAFSQEMLKVAETRKKADVLKSLANLTRFLDITYDTSFHEEFTRWIKRKEIKWNVRTKDDNYHIARQIPLSLILGNIRKLPHDYSVFGMFALVSGLRTGEAVNAFNNHSEICHDGIIEMFWDRQTKRANAVYCHPKLHDRITFSVNRTGIKRNMASKSLGCEIRYLRKLNYTINATKIDPLLAEFMQGRRGNVSQRHYFLPLMSNNRKKWVRVWNSIAKV